MIQFLKKCNISDNVIDRIEKYNSKSNLYNLNCNQDEVIKIINYLSSIGVKNIYELLIYKIERFFVSFNDFKAIFDGKDVSECVKLLNDNYLYFDEL